VTTAEEAHARPESPYDREVHVAAAADEPRRPWPGHGVDVGGQRIFVRTRGTPGAAPALFVHGLGGSSTNWTDLMALLADRLDCHAIDLPGFGRSGPPVTGNYSLDTHVGVSARLHRADLGRPVHLLGNSLRRGGHDQVGGRATGPGAHAHARVRRAAVVPAAEGLGPALPLLLVPGLSRVAPARSAGAAPRKRTRGVIEMCFADPSAVPQSRFAEASTTCAAGGRSPGTTTR
jgi:pimeloyl-ACP methyl ester carboxylesterase